ncbi:MAG: hypothetical protein JRI68_33050 [Deltaproteobacteria bacterium]|nr:hypothetical protein [Deltaproteobacteria bacterium]
MGQQRTIRVALLGTTVWLGLALVLTAAGCGSSSNTETGSSTSTSGTGGVGGALPGGGGVGGIGGGTGGGDCTDEVCDGLDNDCDDEVDEGCLCTDGETQTCYSGDPNLLGLGECAEGLQTCNLAGDWGPCADEVLPIDEVCDGLDNDCDEQIDESFGTVTCGLGICQVTVDECIDGVFNPCLPNQPNPSETCDGTDDNCDGQVDEGCTCVNGTSQACYTGSPQTQNVGECSDGIQTCANGQYGNCVGDSTPIAELCDGLDNDCDSQTDENDPESGSSCTTGLDGVCNPGTEHCANGQLACQQNVQPSGETCNGLDDDCDGSTDENNPGGGGICNTGLLGVCLPGLFECSNGSLLCTQTVQPSTETCNGLDDDCDGSTDENNPGGGGACSTGNQGICDAGTQQCQNGGLQCVQTATSGPETCNGLDDDCDGATDEGNPGGGSSCNTGNSGICATGTDTCQNGSIQCVQDNSPTNETCNGLDDDCDGTPDDGNPGGGGSCSVSGQQGVCASGTVTCQNGSLQCPQSVFPTSETCNGLDDDCDGTPDDGNPGGGGSCTVAGQQGECADGTVTCQNGSLQCPQSVFPVSEICTNGLDDDCDGQTDEGCGGCDWAPSAFPINYGATNSVGDITMDSACNLYIAAGGNQVKKVAYPAGTVTTLSSFSTYTRGIVYHPGNNLLYVAVGSQLYSLTLTGTSAIVPNTNIGTFLQGMDLAPPGWGAYGGHIIIARSNGSVYAVDPNNPNPAVVGTTTGELADVQFDGSTLYVAAYTQGNVLTLSPTGTFSTFSAGPCQPDGLAVQPGQNLFMACGSTDQLYKLTIPGAAASLVASVALNGGWAPAGLIWDGVDNLIVMRDTTELGIYTP